MSKKFPTVWEAEPHTLAKITILGDYLTGWFAILGRSDISRGHDLIYVDGFAGPGEYTNSSKGSPIAALVAARKAKAEVGDGWKAGKIHCVFIEPDKARFENLKNRVSVFENDNYIKIHSINDSFVGGFDTFRRDISGPFRSHFPLFVFIDPFGAKGVPFTVVDNILLSGCAEVLINLDADGIVRNQLVGESQKHHELLDSVFGDSSWKQIGEASFQRKCLSVLNIYKNKLKEKTKYVFSFEMKSSDSSLNYYLVFASKHYKGLEKMKESMKKVDQDGSYRFVDANIDTIPMFRADDIESFASKMLREFSGKEAIYRKLSDFTLNETPFLNPKSILVYLEKDNKITVSSTANRRKYTFPEEKIISVKFEELSDGN